LLVEIAGFEPLVLHNQVMTRLKPDVVRAAEDEWKQSPMADDPSDPADLRQRLLEDIAAQLFLRDVDLPIRREILPNVGSPPSKTKIWHAYESLVVRKIAGLFADVVNQSGKPGYQFDTRFLEVLSTEKRWRDRVVVPFWNEFAPEQWRTLGKAFSNRVPLALALDNELDSISESYGLQTLEENDPYEPPPLPSCLQGLKSRPKPPRTQKATPGDPASVDGVTEAQEPPEDGSKKKPKNEIRPKKDALTADVRAHTSWIGKKADRITVSKRLAKFATSIGPVGQANEYVHSLCAATGPKLPVPPFAGPQDRLVRFGD
jgi:hypothetical protein